MPLFHGLQEAQALAEALLLNLPKRMTASESAAWPFYADFLQTRALKTEEETWPFLIGKWEVLEGLIYQA